ncbi:VOC family protein [Paraburkholderia ferrariae]|uniref:VOC family protein n=1 Tax=Paraburkholderia ferrariae TaxID=386056 RepID=UPI0005A6C016|nr:VOC family protein [Paraburkholderia ferrariae]
MPFSLNRIGQIALSVQDVDRAEVFYRDVLGLRQLFRFGTLTFFDCGGVRLLLEKSGYERNNAEAPVIYFSCADIAHAVPELEGRGVVFSGRPHLIAPMEDHDLWMAFFEDPDGHTLALMHEAPKGYSPMPGQSGSAHV